MRTVQTGGLVTVSPRPLSTARAPLEADDVRCQAHDLKNKLQVVLGYCDVLLGPRGPLDDRQRAARMIGNIRTAAQDSARLASAMMAPPAAPVVAPVDLNTLLIEEIGPLCQELLCQSINVHVERGRHVPAVLVDATWLSRTVLNLAHNARDAILGQSERHNSGVIRFATSLPPLRSETPYALLTVADNGPGIDPAILERIWEPGYSTKSLAVGDRGFGLASVRAFVQEIGGWIDVGSQPGQGTEFTLYLPAVAARG